MARIFLRLQVDFDDDDKVARLARFGRDARGCRDLLVAMWRYCKREQSDGHVPAEVVGKLVYPDPPRHGIRDADRLVEVGLAERTPTGYYFGGFLKHNKSKAEIAEDGKQKSLAGQKGGKASGQVRRGEAAPKQGASPPRSHSSEDRGQSAEDTSLTTSQGERQVTLRAINATEPPEEVCTRHPNGNPTDEPCRGCQRVAERARRNNERAEQAARDAARKARETCPDCHGAVWLDDGTKCEHPNSRRTA